METQFLDLCRYMARRILPAVLAVGIFSALPAQDIQEVNKVFPLWEDQLTAWMTANPDKTLGDMTPQEALSILALSRQNLARREFLRQGLVSSFRFPGSGHFMAGDNIGGSLFSVGSLGITALGIWGAVSLLPGDLKYFNPMVYPLDRVEIELKSYSLMEYLPSLGVLGATAVAQGILGVVSAHLAQPKLMEKASSKDFQFLVPGTAGMVMGAGMRY